MSKSQPPVRPSVKFCNDKSEINVQIPFRSIVQFERRHLVLYAKCEGCQLKGDKVLARHPDVIANMSSY